MTALQNSILTVVDNSDILSDINNDGILSLILLSFYHQSNTPQSLLDLINSLKGPNNQVSLSDVSFQHIYNLIAFTHDISVKKT